MSRLAMRNRLRALAEAASPSLRVIGMAYTGLIGVVAVVLVVSVAFLPVAPVVQQATQPARAVVGSMAQPATTVAASLVGIHTLLPQPVFQLVRAPQVALASELTTTVDAGLEDMAANITPDEPVAAESPPVQTITTRVVIARPRVAFETVAPNPDLAADEVPGEEPEQAVDAIDRAPVQQVVLAESPVQQAANVEAPKPLPPLPVPTPTALQTKARLDAENQAAIDATKASLARFKAEADAANQAAIDARKAAAARVVATPHPTAVAEVARTTLIDAARAATAHAKADANAANQAAIDAAKAHEPAATATSKPTSPPAPATATPLPTPTNPTVTAPEPASIEAVDEQPVIQDEAPVMLALDAPCET